MNLQLDQTLEMPPFPLLIWNTYSWEFTDFFASWKGFLVDQRSNTGLVEGLVVVERSRNGQPPTPEQAIAYQFLKENEEAVTNALLKGVFDRASQIRETCEPKLDLPFNSIDDLREIIALNRIYVNLEAKDNCAYVGFEFDSMWDLQYGFSVMMHKTEFIGWSMGAIAAFNLREVIEAEKWWADQSTQPD